MVTQSRVFAYIGRMVGALTAVAISVIFNAGVSQAASSRLPATYYPAGAHTTFRPTISNQQMDCMWGFFCEGQLPLFHFFSQDQLHRVSGWGQFSGLRRADRMVMGFELFASRYRSSPDLDGTPFAKDAFDDLIHATRARGYTPLARQPYLLPANVAGDSIAEVQRVSTSELIVMACWSGTAEVEAIVTVDHGSGAERSLAVRDLTNQVRRAAGYQ